jgi:hypothetical protein
MAGPSIREPQWPDVVKRRDEMTDYSQAEQGKKVLAISVLFFSQGLVWFGFDTPGGIFTLQPLNMSDAFFRIEIVVGAIVTACGILVWRSASRKLSPANYVIVASCVAVLLLCVSKQSEWVYLLDHQSGFSILNILAILVIEITVPVCIFVFGGCWADSAFMRGRFYRTMPSSRFVK